MQCYKTYAATIVIGNYLEVMPAIGRKLPHAAIADWMTQHDIDPEDVLYTAPLEIKARLEGLIDEGHPQLPDAA